MAAIYGAFGPPGQKALEILRQRGKVAEYGDGVVTLLQAAPAGPVKGCNTIGLIDGNIINRHELFEATSHPARKPEEVFVHVLEDLPPQKALEKLDGDYSIAFWNGSRLVLLRDPIGSRPLFYTEEPFAFASERKMLGGGKPVLPGEALLVEGGRVLTRRWYDPFKVKKIKTTAELAAAKLVKLLERAVEKRVEGKTAIAFSGGLDSAIIAELAAQYCKPTLFVAGLAQSHDPYNAIKAAKAMDLPLERVTITEAELPKLVELATAATEKTEYLQTQIAVAFYALFRRIKTRGYPLVLAGQGADELFGGYARYQKFARDGILEQELEKDFRELAEKNLERDYLVASANGLDLRVPYLDREVVKFARSLPAGLKANETERKIVLKEVARKLGLPKEICEAPKKAIQYGSGVSRVLR